MIFEQEFVFLWNGWIKKIVKPRSALIVVDVQVEHLLHFPHFQSLKNSSERFHLWQPLDQQLPRGPQWGRSISQINIVFLSLISTTSNLMTKRWLDRSTICWTPFPLPCAATGSWQLWPVDNSTDRDNDDEDNDCDDDENKDNNHNHDHNQPRLAPHRPRLLLRQRSSSHDRQREQSSGFDPLQCTDYQRGLKIFQNPGSEPLSNVRRGDLWGTRRHSEDGTSHVAEALRPGPQFT